METTTTKESNFPLPRLQIFFFLIFNFIAMLTAWLIRSVTWYSPPKSASFWELGSVPSSTWLPARSWHTPISTVTKAATSHRGNHSGFCEVNSRYLYSILCTVYKTNVVLWITNNSWNINNRKMYFKIELCSINRSLTKVTSLFSCTWAFNVLSFCAFSIMLSLLPCNAKDKFKAKKIKNSITYYYSYRGEAKSVPDTGWYKFPRRNWSMVWAEK